MPISRRDYLRASRQAVWASGATTLVLLSLPLWLGEYYFGRDLSFYDAGLLCEIKARLAAGDGLALSPMLGNGSPLWADPQGQLLYPLRWLQVLLPINLATSLGPILHLTIAAAGAAWLARTFCCRPVTAYGLGVSFAFCGTCLDLTEHACYVVGAAWVPIAWAAARRLIAGDPRRFPRALLVASLAGCLLGGEPQSFAVAAGILVIEGLLSSRRARPGKGRRAATTLGLAIGGAFGVGFVAWAPALAELALTQRLAAGFNPAEVLKWSFGPPEWLATLFPGILLEPLVGGDLHGVLLGVNAPLDWNANPYLGVLLMVCAARGLALPRARPASVVLVLALVASLGDHFPLLVTLLKWVPPLRLFRYPQKYLLEVSLGAVIVAGVSIERFSRGKRRELLFAAAIMATLLAMAGLAVALRRGQLDRLVEGIATPAAEGLPTLSTMVLEKLRWSLAVLGVAVLLWLVSRRVARLVPLVIAADMILSAPNSLQAGPPVLDVLSPLRSLSSSRPDETPVFCFEEPVEHLNYEFGNPWGNVLAGALLGFTNLNACSQISSSDAYSIFRTPMQEVMAAALVENRSRAARALGCTHVISTLTSHWDVPMTRVAAPGIDERGLVEVLAVPDPLPRAFVSLHPALSTNEPELVSRLAQSSSAEEAARQVDDPLHHLTNMALPAGDGVAVQSLSWAHRSHAEVTLTSKSAAVIGLRTAYRVGWHATQAGRDLDVVRIAGANVGAVVDNPAGGPVLFEYRPPRLWLSLLSGLIGISLIAKLLWRAPRGPVRV